MRLIDADALIEEINKNDSLPWNLDRISQRAFVSCIEHTKTAYDVDEKPEGEGWNAEVFEEIIEKLEEEREYSHADFDEYVEECSPYLDIEYDDCFYRGLERAVKVIKETVKDRNNGWIPCSERLPGK